MTGQSPPERERPLILQIPAEAWAVVIAAIKRQGGYK